MWKDIKHAPKVVGGYPLWVKGNDFGNPMAGEHYGWVYWDGLNWIASNSGGAKMLHLTHYMDKP